MLDDISSSSIMPSTTGSTTTNAAVILDLLERFLQYDDDNNDGTTQSPNNSLRNKVLYIIYLSVLGICCLAPCYYYCRIRYSYRIHVQQLQALENAGLNLAITQSENNNTTTQDTSILRDERHARILQLMEPVQMVLQEHHFHYSDEPPEEAPPEKDKDENDQTMAADSESDEEEGSSIDHEDKIEVPEAGLNYVVNNNNNTADDAEMGIMNNNNSNAESVFPWCGKTETRLAPANCAICLSTISCHQTVVWSSNETCSHVFHKHCMEEVIEKGTILCPICRRDFLIDPYDNDQQPTDESNNN